MPILSRKHGFALVIVFLSILGLPTVVAAERSTDEVINQRDRRVLFYSSGEGCEETPNANPEWMLHQSEPSLNDDGTPTYGFAYNTGGAGDVDWRFEPRRFAKEGSCVLRMTIDNTDEGARAIRVFRNTDQRGRALPNTAYYSAWFWFPENVDIGNRQRPDGSIDYGFWNVMQVKNRLGDDVLSGVSIDAGRYEGEDAMTFSLWNKAMCGAVEECSAAEGAEQGRPIAIPTEQWVHLEMRLVARNDRHGRVVLWQDGQRILTYRGQTKRSGTDELAFSVNNYGRFHRPVGHSVFVDEVAITKFRVGYRIFR